jgi:hypothetical protein
VASSSNKLSKSKAISNNIVHAVICTSIRYKGLGDPDQAKVASLKEQLNAKLDVYDKILVKQPYLAGQVNFREKLSVHVLFQYT